MEVSREVCTGAILWKLRTDGSKLCSKLARCALLEVNYMLLQLCQKQDATHNTTEHLSQLLAMHTAVDLLTATADEWAMFYC